MKSIASSANRRLQRINFKPVLPLGAIKTKVAFVAYFLIDYLLFKTRAAINAILNCTSFNPKRLTAARTCSLTDVNCGYKPRLNVVMAYISITMAN